MTETAPRPINILAVDDDERNIAAITSALSGLTFSVTKANSGQEALELLDHRDWAVILIGVNMPTMDGFSVASSIRDAMGSQNVPIIFMTDHDIDEQRLLDAVTLGSADYVAKPYPAIMLRTKVQVLADLFNMARENAESWEKQQSLLKALERSGHELAQFSNIVSHDLKAPLNHIVQVSHLLKNEIGQRVRDLAGSDIEKFIEVIEGSAKDMRELTDGLLAFGRLDSTALNFGLCDLEAILRSLCEKFGASGSLARAAIAIGKMPTIDADQVLIRQMFYNLIENSLKFRASPETESEIDISAEITGNGSNCRIVMRDNGIGFEQKSAKKIFSPLVRLVSRSEYPGSGVGLTSVKKIVERHRGQIWADGEPGVGSTFTIELPVNQDA